MICFHYMNILFRHAKCKVYVMYTIIWWIDFSTSMTHIAHIQAFVLSFLLFKYFISIMHVLFDVPFLFHLFVYVLVCNIFGKFPWFLTFAFSFFRVLGFMMITIRDKIENANSIRKPSRFLSEARVSEQKFYLTICNAIDLVEF